MRKELLLEVAFEKFAQKGYNTSLSEIAKGAGIRKQSIYNHFKDKDELLYETIKIELLSFYASKSSEFEGYMQGDVKEALRAMFFSICSYYDDTNRLKFWRWILLIESKDLFTRCRDLIREKEGKFYSRIKLLLERELEGYNVNEDELKIAVQSFVVMIHGVLNGLLLYHEVYDSHILIENTWLFYWQSINNLKK